MLRNRYLIIPLIFLLAPALQRCKQKDPDGPGGGGNPERFFSYGLVNDSLNRNYDLAGPPPAVSGGAVFSAGQLYDNTYSQLLFAMRPDSTFHFMKRIRTGLYGISSLTPDGAGGVLLHGYTSSNIGYRPWVGRMNSAGALLWSKDYDGPGLTIMGTDQFIRGSVSEIRNGKCVLLSPASVAVLDAATGSVLWRKSASNAGDVFNQAAVDENGFTTIGSTGEAMMMMRFDWSGNAQWMKSGGGGVAAGFAFSPPVAAGTDLIIPYIYKDAPTRNPRFAIVRMGADGTMKSQWSYKVDGTYDNRGIMLPQTVETVPFRVQMTENGELWCDITAVRYTGNGQYAICNVAGKINADGEVLNPVPVYASNHLVYAGANTVLAHEENGGVLIGDIRPACRVRGVTDAGMQKVAAPGPVLQMNALSRTMSAVTTTANDLLLTLEDVGPLHTQFLRNCPSL